MAENKKSFVLYCDLIKSIEHLTNEEKGILFTHLLEYVNDMNPILTDRLIITAWKPIELQLKRDLDKYRRELEKKSESGRLGNLKRYHLDIYERYLKLEFTLEQAEAIALSRKVSQCEEVPSHPIAFVADNVTVTDTVTDNEINIECADKSTPPPKHLKTKKERKDEFAERLKPFVTFYSKDMLNKFYSYWTESGEKDKKLRFEKEKVFEIERRLYTWSSRESNQPKFTQQSYDRYV